MLELLTNNRYPRGQGKTYGHEEFIGKVFLFVKILELCLLTS